MKIGARTYDASNKNNFQMRAQLMWTINDFPAYADLSGWPNRGEKACPICMMVELIFPQLATQCPTKIK